MKNKSRKKSLSDREQDFLIKYAKALPTKQKLLAQEV